MSKDVIILGSGPNELVAACYLAKQGHSVSVLERSDQIGGAFAFADIGNAKGFRLEPSPPALGWVAPKIVKDLGLRDRGFEEDWSEAAVATPNANGKPLVLWRDLGKSIEEIKKHSATDASKWEAFSTRMHRLAGFLETLYTEPPPRLMSEQTGDLFSLLATGLRLRRLGKIDMVELLRTLPMSVQDLLDESFESDLLKATVGAGGTTNLLQGPRSAGTCFVMLHHFVGRPLGAFRARRIVKSEQGHLMKALGLVAKELGVELQTNAPAKVIIENGRAVGVTVEGKELRSRFVVSGADPKSTFLEMVHPTELEDPEFVHAVRNVKLRGANAIVNLALDAKPAFTGLDDAALSGVISIGDHLDDLERAYDDAKHGGISKRPWLQATIPSLSDPSLAPAGKHVMSVAVQYAPYHLREGSWTAATKDALADSVIARLTEHSPTLAKLIVDRTVHTPVDLETRFGMREGHLYGGELTLDQILFMRPIPGFAHYRTPIENLFMCGDACHPGGGLPGLAGANAAREIAKDA